MKNKTSIWPDLVKSLDELDRKRGFRLGSSEIFDLFLKANRDPDPESRAERIEALLVQYYPKPIRD
jgi:hypothetical protein